jgi:hypothetical protein
MNKMKWEEKLQCKEKRKKFIKIKKEVIDSINIIMCLIRKIIQIIMNLIRIIKRIMVNLENQENDIYYFIEFFKFVINLNFHL